MILSSATWHLPSKIISQTISKFMLTWKVNGGTIPKEMVVTSSLPDLVIVDSSTPVKTVYLFEMTVCFEETNNIHSAHHRKMDRSLSADIEERGYSCKNIPFKVRSRGHLTPDNKSILTIIHKLISSKVLPKHFIDHRIFVILFQQ